MYTGRATQPRHKMLFSGKEREINSISRAIMSIRRALGDEANGIRSSSRFRPLVPVVSAPFPAEPRARGETPRREIQTRNWLGGVLPGVNFNCDFGTHIEPASSPSRIGTRWCFAEGIHFASSVHGKSMYREVHRPTVR